MPYVLHEEAIAEVPQQQVVEVRREELQPVAEEVVKKVPRYDVEYVEKVVEVQSQVAQETSPSRESRRSGTGTAVAVSTISTLKSPSVHRESQLSQLYEQSTCPKCGLNRVCGSQGTSKKLHVLLGVFFPGRQQCVPFFEAKLKVTNSAQLPNDDITDPHCKQVLPRMWISL